VEFHLFLPQMRMTVDDLVARAVAAEAAGFDGIALMDHLAPPLAEDQPMFEAMVTATWLAARTERLKVGHLVLCDSFRHPAVLARQAVTIDHASGGRFELGIGWGSVPTEYDVFGIGSLEAKVRVARLRETLEVIRLLWSGETVSYEGEHHVLRDARQQPVPLGRIPIVIGGAGPATRRLVAEHADWWNVPLHRLEVLDDLAEGQIGLARGSVQQMVALVPSEAQRAEVEATAMRRFGGMAAAGGLAIGNASELTAHFATLAGRGVERVYTWFADFAPPATLAAFAEVVAG
jgi:alkanesulfonate monooxygenase SsuD/methylene tetrahydromethanopterin reductase-like flavin-dependent oxidoreductase (luciferase family)